MNAVSAINEHSYEGYPLGDLIYNLSDFYGKEALDAKPEEIVTLLENAAKSGVADAQFRLGWFYGSGRSRLIDSSKAIHYYEKAIEQRHPDAPYQLASLLLLIRQEPENSPRIIDLLERAAKRGNPHALNDLGYKHVYKKIEGAQPREGVKFLIRSAELGYREAMRNLGEIANNEELNGYFSKTELERWKQAETDVKKVARESAKDALSAASPWIESKNYATAIAIIDEHYSNYRILKTKDLYSFLSPIWWDAQTQRGRLDPEWSWRLFDWCRRQYDNDLFHLAENRLTVRRNMISGLVDVGRMGLARETCDDLRNLLTRIYGLSFNQKAVWSEISPDGTMPNHVEFDIRVSRSMAKRASWNIRQGKMLTDSVASALNILGNERLDAGDWRGAFYYSKWVEKWATTVLSTGKAPNDHPIEWVEEALQISLQLRAQTHVMLGNFEEAIATYDEIINDGRTPYRGRITDNAIVESSILRSRIGYPASISIPELEALEAKQIENQFDFSHPGETNKIARAWIFHKEREFSSAQKLLNQVFEFTEKHDRPFLRIRALMTSVEFSIDMNALAKTEEQITEALDLARKKGLRNLEPSLYELYARFLAAKDRNEEAIRVQKKAIKMLEHLEFDTQHSVATNTLTQYLESISNQNALTQDETNSSRSKDYTAKPSHLSNHASRLRPTAFDLQPKRITFAPIQSKNSEAIFTLSNPGAHAISPSLTITSSDVSIIESSTGGMLFGLSDLNQESDSTQNMAIQLAPLDQILIRFLVPANLSDQKEISLSLSAQWGETNQTVDLVVLTASAAKRIHVINAAEIQNNPFYLIPVFHQISKPDDALDSVNVRTIASEPTRVECYDENGKLCFVDAQGNGSFEDPGDLLLTEHIDSSYPAIMLEKENAQFEFRYLPINNLGSERIEVEIQTRRPSTSEWETDVVDWILL